MFYACRSDGDDIRLIEQRHDGIARADPFQCLGQQFGAGQLSDFGTLARGIGQRDGVGDDQFIQRGCGDAFDGRAGQYRVRAVADDHLGASFFQRFCGLCQGTGGIDHIIHDDAVPAFDIADDVHDFGLVRAWPALVDDRQVASQTFRQRACADDAADIGRDDKKILVVFLLEILEQDGRGIDIVDRDIEEALNLVGVDVHDKDTIDADTFKDVGNHTCGDGDTCGTRPAILTCIAEIGDAGSDPFGRSALECIDHENDFHQVIIGGSTGGLDDEDILAADIFIDFDSGFAVGELGDVSLAERDAEFAGDLGGQCRIGIAGENH